MGAKVSKGRILNYDKYIHLTTKKKLVDGFRYVCHTCYVYEYNRTRITYSSICQSHTLEIFHSTNEKL